MRIARAFAIGTLALAVSFGIAAAQDKGGGGKGGGKGGRGGGGIPAPVILKIAAYPDGGAIPASVGCANGNMATSPAMSWSGAPAATMAYAVVLHDPDVAVNGDDVLHWAIYNIPATATGLPAAVPVKAMLDDGSMQINNIAGGAGFMGPCPPAPTVHHYVFEIYALNAKLDMLPVATTRLDLIKAMGSKIIAKGVYTGTYKQ
jgi:Raf kinase inhibitor-like YbhB/YbcL family protein